MNNVIWKLSIEASPGRFESIDSTYEIAYATYYLLMTSMTATRARTMFYRLLEEVQKRSTPLLITGKHGNAVLVSEDDWRAIEETLYLLSIPGMRESIRKGMREPAARCVRRIDL